MSPASSWPKSGGPTEMSGITERDREKLRALASQRQGALASAKKGTAALRVEVVYLVERGMSESEAARLAGVSRLTVRSWLGKDK